MKNPAYICPRCGNSDSRSIGFLDGKPYCRKCVSFDGKLAKRHSDEPRAVTLDLKYRLSSDQERLSKSILDNYIAKKDTLVYAVCGAGKTELSFEVIKYALLLGQRVGFALPRRDVVIELFFRLRDAFPENSVVAVYGQHNSRLNGDLIILTTHQLYRYPDYFDLLVMDEIDAFPFKGNDVLLALFQKSLRGHCVMMSATPSKRIIAEFKTPGHTIVELRTRFHRHPIPVPEPIIRYGPFKYPFLIKKIRFYQREKLPSLVFVPSIALSEEVYRIISPFLGHGNFVNSKRNARSDIIDGFKHGKFTYLVTTAVLERGVTIRGLQVIVFASDHGLYDSTALIQIAGRVGRKMDAPEGEVIFLADKKTKAMEAAIKEIRFCNTFL